MLPAARLRASDQDRSEAVHALGEHHAAGRITLPEFTARMERALGCTYLDELDQLFVDLPARQAVPAMRVAPGHLRRSGPPPVAMLAVPLLAVLAVVAVGAGFFFPFWLPILLLWVMGRPRRGPIGRSTCAAGPASRYRG
jgi:hypothetical protein